MNITSETRERNYGVDALRLISMLMVVMLHVLGHGGILDVVAGKTDTGMYRMAWLLETGAYCCVDCFALISGYVGVKSRFRLSRIVRFWLQIAFWMLLTTVLFCIFKPDVVTGETWLDVAFPVTRSVYWYATAYFGLLFLSPVLSAGLNVLKERQLAVLGAFSVAVFVIVPFVLEKSPYLFSSGYSMAWLILLYMLGGIIYRCRITDMIKGPVRWVMPLLYAAGVFIAWLCKINGNGRYVSYTSPLIFLCSVSLLLFFASLRVGRSAAKVIAFASPCAFGVYLIHTQPLSWVYLTKDVTIPFTEKSVGTAAVLCVLSAIGVFAVCLLLDKLRECLFRLIGIDRLCLWIDRLTEEKKSKKKAEPVPRI